MATRILALLLITSAACSSSGADDQAALDRCVSNGVAYFKEIGSYPTLSDGREAEDVAIDRCSRTTTAFPDPQ